MCVNARARFCTMTFEYRGSIRHLECRNALVCARTCIDVCEIQKSVDYNHVHGCVYNVISMFVYASADKCIFKCVCVEGGGGERL